jgi:hypothetical protein
LLLIKRVEKRSQKLEAKNFQVRELNKNLETIARTSQISKLRKEPKNQNPKLLKQKSLKKNQNLLNNKIEKITQMP